MEVLVCSASHNSHSLASNLPAMCCDAFNSDDFVSAFFYFGQTNTLQLVAWLNHCPMFVYFIGVDRTFCSVLFQLCGVFFYLQHKQQHKQCYMNERVLFVLQTNFFFHSLNLIYPSTAFYCFPNKIKGFPLTALLLFFFLVSFLGKSDICIPLTDTH